LTLGANFVAGALRNTAKPIVTAETCIPDSERLRAVRENACKAEIGNRDSRAYRVWPMPTLSGALEALRADWICDYFRFQMRVLVSASMLLMVVLAVSFSETASVRYENNPEEKSIDVSMAY